MQAVQSLFAHPDGVNHDAFHLITAQQIEIVQLLIDFVVGVTHQRGKAFFPAGGFDAAEDIHRVGIGDIGDDQADQARAAMLQATGHQTGAVIEFGDSLFNTGQQRVGQQVFFAVEITGNAGFTGFCGFRHVADGGPC